jgi:hypothetical protein
MKTFTKIILVFIISVSTFAQIDTLQRIETRSIEFSIASLPSNQGDTLFVVNYFQLGQIYTVYSLDEGKTWEYPGSGDIYAKVVGRHGLSSLRIPDRYQRIFIA